MRKKMLRGWWTGVLLVFAGGCGQGTEPMTTLGDASQSRGVQGGMLLPLASSVQGLLLRTPFSSSNDGFDLQGTFNNTQTRAPAAGVVTYVDAGSYTVTLLHNQHVSTTIKGIDPTVQVGNYIASGSSLGNVSRTALFIHFTVTVDGTAVCPLSYLDSASRAQLITYYTANPCQQ